ncbi:MULTISPECIES: acyl-CoA thioesterase [Marinomonas]|uniref:Acyl-CoA thioesterase n=1 Tax=Marinomonas arctica TaxID=383750 RepID=A0A7H1J2M0_9GAMM|nr:MULTISPECIES: thioesterase family protein [Marinomonas]MCS7486451.1 thioesterase [Marinomonas sp. BSi20414]QNT04736.1 acyl-CoA thioesterase [Marinomonas arctica]GGN30539.1 thioesterase [Marinomonas arctica]
MFNKTRIKVRGYHLDLFQHVNNARYLEFIEEGRWAFFDEFFDKDDWMQQDLVWPVVNININFKSEANFGDLLEVQTHYTKIGNRSITMKQTIINVETNTPVVEADVTYVCFSKAAKAAIPFPDDIRQKVEQSIAEFE